MIYNILTGLSNFNVRLKLVPDSLHDCIKSKSHLLSHNGRVSERGNGSDFQNRTRSVNDWQRNCFIAGHGSDVKGWFIVIASIELPADNDKFFFLVFPKRIARES